ncbi:hypothetical protein RJ639_046301 [Escallonia herrerae]|uniref:Alpha/beta hydrolase fold-3 domain-containing protein n=1 Tax=Escallonia herrerae TaxID=1293975 RepID=A0AA89AI57_9ASTE|nr:hypothetical protein RJ639_018740 [Escallonia herrerae]KAK3021594.1 hypothetical protein RJ639_046301 [Escallonia herrerae]
MAALRDYLTCQPSHRHQMKTQSVVSNPKTSPSRQKSWLDSTSQSSNTQLENSPSWFTSTEAHCVGSVYTFLCHNFINSLVSQAKALAVSVEYRLAPEHPLPAAYEDCWAALQWVASYYVASNITNSKPWLIDHGDYDRVYIGGDSAGGNIVHNITMHASIEHINNDIKIMGGYACFLTSWRSELSKNYEQSLLYRFWMVACPSARGGIDNPMMNPWAEDAPSLSGLACSRLLVCVGEKDKLRDRGIRYCEELRKSGWKGEVELVEIEGENHCFHIFNPGTENAKNLVKRLASFIIKELCVLFKVSSLVLVEK